MLYFKSFIFLLILFSLVSAVYSQKFSKARVTEKNSYPKTFHFKALNNVYSVNAKTGKAQRNSKALKKKFQVPLKKGDSIEKIYFSEYKNDLFLLYETGDGDAAATQLIRLDAKTNKLKWKAWIPTFNTVGVLDNNNGYFAGTGFIAKISLPTGRFIWKQENLYTEKYGKINIFDPPKIETNKVIFGKSEEDTYTKAKELVVDRTTGKILGLN